MARVRMVIGRATAVLVALLVVTACANAHETTSRSISGSIPAGTVVPWIDEPSAWPTSTPTPAPSGAPCVSDDLSATASVAARHLGISQEDAANVTVTNVGRRRCELTGTPVLLMRVGSRYESVATRTGVWSSGSVVVPASIGAGERAFVQIAKTLACNGGTGATTAAGLALSIGRRRLPIPGLTLSGTCSGVFVSPWFTLAPEPRSALAGLTASIEAGTSVQRGRPLTYTVALTNTSDVAVVLDPCPVYGESIGKHMRLYLLNCASGDIAPHLTVRFAMMLDVPADLAPGDTVLGWQLIDPAGLPAQATRHIDVTA